MAGSPEEHAPDAHHYVDYEEYVDVQLEKTRSSIKLTDIFTTLTALAVLVISYLLAFVVLDHWVLEGGFGYAARVGLLSLLTVVVLGIPCKASFCRSSSAGASPLRRRRHRTPGSETEEQPCVNFVETCGSRMHPRPRSCSRRCGVNGAAVELSQIDVEEAVDRRPLLRIAYCRPAGDRRLLGTRYHCLAQRRVCLWWRRALLPTAAIEAATETVISDVTPGDKDVPARTVLTVEADVRGKDADRVQILYTTADHKYVDQPVEMKRIEETMPRFRGVLNGDNGVGLLQNLTYRIVAGDARTREFAINVIQSPSAAGVDEVKYVFAKYMELEDKAVSGGHIDGWEGATVTVNATANVPVKLAKIVRTDSDDPMAQGEETSMRVTDGIKLSAEWRLDFRNDGTFAHFYHIWVKTENGETDPDPTEYTILIRNDQRPEVALLAPTASQLTMPANGVIPLVIQASDPDFQLRSIALKSERNSEVFPDRKLFDGEILGQTFRGNYDFRLSDLPRLIVGETIHFWIEVKDNKQPTANRATTPKVKVHIVEPVSVQKAQQDLAKEKEKQQDQLARADEARNSDRETAPPPAPGADREDDKPQPRPEPPAAGEERPKTPPKAPEANRESSPNPPDKAKEEKPGQPPQRKPDDFQEALQKLLQQEKQQPADQNGEQQQQPADKEPPKKDSAQKQNGSKDSQNGNNSEQQDLKNANKPKCRFTKLQRPESTPRKSLPQSGPLPAIK